MAEQDKELIARYTEKSIAGMHEESLKETWERFDHMYRGEFVSPTRPELYFANDDEVDAYRDAIERMDGTIASPQPAPFQPDPFQADETPAVQTPDNPLVDVIREQGPSSASTPSGNPLVDVIREQGVQAEHAQAATFELRKNKHDDDDDYDDDRDDDDKGEDDD